MSNKPESQQGFTLLELLIVIAIIAILAALLLPVLSKVKSSARRAVCVSNLRQISLGVRMYADDHTQMLPTIGGSAPGPVGWIAYKSLMKGYVTPSGPSSPQEQVFHCPADKFFYDTSSVTGPMLVAAAQHDQPVFDFSSYAFNGGNLRANPISGQQYPGLSGEKLTAVQEPSRTVLVADAPSFLCYSWHQPRALAASVYQFSNARNVASFVDGHVHYLRFYYDSTKARGIESWQYDPPNRYDYRWTPR